MSDEFTFEFATRDDCLRRMVPSDLRGIIAERDKLSAEITSLQPRTCDWTVDPEYDRRGFHTVGCNGKSVYPYRIDEHPYCMFCGGRINLVGGHA